MAKCVPCSLYRALPRDRAGRYGAGGRVHKVRLRGGPRRLAVSGAVPPAPAALYQDGRREERGHTVAEDLVPEQ